MPLLLALLGPLALGTVFALAVLHLPVLRPLRDHLTGRERQDGDGADPTLLAALDALEAAALATEGDAVSFELYVAPGDLPGVEAVAGIPVMHSRAARPGCPIVFDRLRMRYLTDGAPAN